MTLLAGCAAATTALAPPATDLNATQPSAAAAQAALLYVSDWDTNDVFVYNFATHAAVGQLTGLRRPSGQCVDASHNVWITELQGLDVVEYAHGGKAPIKRLKTGGYPIGCAIDAATGDLAVANLYTKNGPGSLQIWKNAAGTPATFTSSTLHDLWPPAYDDKGDVFVEGQFVSGAGYGVSELPRGGKTLRSESLKGATIHFAGAALWDGAHIGLTDQSSASGDTTVVYRTDFVGAVGSVVGRTHLLDPSCHAGTDVVVPDVVHRGPAIDVIGGNIACRKRFDLWSYPAGGNRKAALRGAPNEPFAESVSPPN